MFRGISFSSKAKFIQNTRTLFRKQAEYRKGTVLWGQRRGCIILRKNEKSYSCLPKTKVTFRRSQIQNINSLFFLAWHHFFFCFACFENSVVYQNNIVFSLVTCLAVQCEWYCEEHAVSDVEEENRAMMILCWWCNRLIFWKLSLCSQRELWAIKVKHSVRSKNLSESNNIPPVHKSGWKTETNSKLLCSKIWTFLRECPGIFFISNLQHRYTTGGRLASWGDNVDATALWSDQNSSGFEGDSRNKAVCINFSRHVAPCFGLFSGQLPHLAASWTRFNTTPGVCLIKAQ